MTVEITRDNYDVEVAQSERPVLLDFWAGWCAPCRALAPVIDEIASEHPEIKVGKVNVEEQGELTRRFRVMGIPALVAMENGEVVARATGALPKEEILALFD